MATTVDKTIKKAGGDYSTPAAWEDDTDNTSLVTADEVRRGVMYGVNDIWTLTALVTMAGATVDATRHRALIAASADSFRGNAGKLTNLLKYNGVNGVAIDSNQAYTGMFSIDENYFQMEGLQLEHQNRGVPVTCNNTGVELRDLIVESSGAWTTNNLHGISILGGTAKVINSLVVMRKSGAANGRGIHTSYVSGSKILHCTIVRPSDATSGNEGIGGNSASAAGGVIVKDTAVFGFPTDFTASVSWGAGSGFNATDAAAAPGSSNQVSKTFSSQFQAVTDTARDFRVKAGGDLSNGSTDADANAEDILGQARSTPTIGAMELIVAATTIPNRVVMAMQSVKRASHF